MKIQWSKLSLQDRNGILDYLADKNPRAAVDLDLRIEKAVEDLLEDHPNAGKTGRVDGTREFFIPNTTYVVVYQVSQSSIHILRVLHTSMMWP